MPGCDGFVCVDDFEKYALRTLSKNAADYYRSGANNEQTLKENRRAFFRLRIRPRCLRDVSHRDLSTQILGQPVSFPVGVAPSAMQKMAHPDGEIANVKAASAAGTVMILSTISTTSIEDVAKAAPSGLKWFQLYIYRDREITKQLVMRAEKNGYKALVLTVDTPLFGNRLADARNRFSLPPHLRLANFNADDVKLSAMNKTSKGSSLGAYSTDLFDPTLTWKDIHWLRTITTLPIVAKGILTAEDAILAVQNGVDAILVSNHGARQLDGVPATIEALPEIVRAVSGRCEVYLDGGVRTGTDVLKALALGAKAVFLGRPILWGLAHSGQEGAAKILEILRDELDVAMGLAAWAFLIKERERLNSSGLEVLLHVAAACLHPGNAACFSVVSLDRGVVGTQIHQQLIAHYGNNDLAQNRCTKIEDIKPSMVVRQEFYSRL